MTSKKSWSEIAAGGRIQTNAVAPRPPTSASIRAEAHRRNRKRNQRIGGLTLLVGITLGILPRLQSPTLEQRASLARDWLVAQQHIDGSWSAGTTVSRFPTHQVGVTSLALLGLLEQKVSSFECQESIDHALAWILARQDGDGSFAPAGPDRVTVHGMATRALALARSQGLLAKEQYHAVDRAERFLARTQLPGGGWGYDVPSDGYSYQRYPAITSASVWPIRALALAPQFKQAYSRSIDWIAAQRTSDGGFRYRSQPTADPDPGATLMSALCLHEAGRTPPASQAHPTAPKDDLYLGYFHAAQPGSTGYVEALAERQNDDGSWPLDDRWSAPGGPVYTTAMALLTLASD